MTDLGYLSTSYLATSVRVAQNIVLGKIAMGRENNYVKDHGDSAKECLQSARIRCLKEIQQKLNHFQHTLSGVTPPSLQTNLLELVVEVIVWGLWCQCSQIFLSLP